jgi:hypothetical protein
LITPVGGIYTISNIKNDATVTVTGVTKNTFNVTTSVTNGTITGSKLIGQGEDFVVNYNPDTGYHLTSVTVNGGSVSIITYPSSYTFNNVIAANSIAVTNVINTYTVEFYDFSGNVIKTYSNVSYGTSVSSLFDGTEPSPLMGVFTGWDMATVSPVAPHGSTIEIRPVSLPLYVVQLPGTQTGYTLTPDAGSSSPVIEGGSFTFVFSLNEGYTNSPFTVKVDGVPIGLTGGKYTITGIMSNVTVTVENVLKNTYPVTLTPGDGYTLSGSSAVTHGNDYSFTLALDTAHSNSTPVVTVTGYGTVMPVSGVYTVEDVTSAITVTVAGVEKNTYPVTLTPGTGYTLNGDETVTHGNDYSFTLSLDGAYNKSTPKVNVIGYGIITPDEGIYTVENVTSAITVTVEDIEKNTYTVTLTPGDEYTLTPHGISASPVEHGGSFSFTLSVTTGYIGTPVVKMGDYILTDVEGIYTIENITHDITIIVAELDLSTFNVGPLSGTEYILTEHSTSGSPVTYGGSFSFTLTHKAGYIGIPVVKANDVIIDPFGDIYIIANITEDQIITVEGLELSTFTVSPMSGTGYTLAASGGSSSPVNYNGSFSFTLSVTTGYIGTPVVKANGTTLTAIAGVYTISGIQADQTITVDGLSLSNFTVSLPSGAGYSVTAYGGSTSPVTYGGSFTFQFSRDTGYSGGTVLVNGSPVILDGNGRYTITNITGPQTVTLSGLTKNVTPDSPSGGGSTGNMTVLIAIAVIAIISICAVALFMLRRKSR